MSSKVLLARSQLGVACQRGDSDAQHSARQKLAAAKLEAYIERVLAEAPPLDDDQRTRIAALLRPGPSAEPAA